MADADADDELESLREKKLDDLRRRAEGGDVDGDGATGAAGADADSSATATPGEPIHVESKAHYEELISAHDLVLVDFYADWCGPCKMLEPIVADLAAETDAAVLKVDIDVHQGLAREMQVQGVPTLYVYSGGEVADRVVGVKGKEELRSMLQRAA